MTPTRRDQEELLAHAIRGHWLVEFRYGDEERWLMVAPCAVASSAFGKVTVTGITVAGPAERTRGRPPSLFDIDRMEALHLTNDQFHPAATTFDRLAEGAAAAADDPA